MNFREWIRFLFGGGVRFICPEHGQLDRPGKCPLCDAWPHIESGGIRIAKDRRLRNQ